MSQSKDAELILSSLLENQKAELKTAEILNCGKWSSGSQITRAIHELEKEGLVSFSESQAIVRMTADTVLALPHPNYRKLVPIGRRFARAIVPWVRPVVITVTSIFTFVWLMLSQVLAPEKYCDFIPNLAAEWLSTCVAWQE